MQPDGQSPEPFQKIRFQPPGMSWIVMLVDAPMVPGAVGLMSFRSGNCFWARAIASLAAAMAGVAGAEVGASFGSPGPSGVGAGRVQPGGMVVGTCPQAKRANSSTSARISVCMSDLLTEDNDAAPRRRVPKLSYHCTCYWPT